jgi:hypothetical protein
LSKRLIVLLVGVLAIAAGVTGCGGSDDDSGEALTKSQWIAQADAICEKGDEEIETEYRAFAEEEGLGEEDEPNEEQGTELVETIIVPSTRSQHEQIGELAPPEGDEEQVSSLLDSLDEAISELEEDPQVLFDADADPFGPANEKAEAYGLQVCGE